MENQFNVKRSVVMMCGPTMYENITCDKEITECNGIKFDYPFKFVYDPSVRIYYTILKASPKFEGKIGDNDIIIIYASQFGKDVVAEPEMFASIARITNFATSVSEGEAEDKENTEE